MRKLVYAYLFGIPLGVVFFGLSFYMNFMDGIHILFYRGIVIISIILIIQVFVLITLLCWKGDVVSAVPNAITIGMICFTLNISFFIVVPVSLDRSVSVFLLGYMNEKSTPVSKAQLNYAFDTIYVSKYKAIDRRIDEQLISGNLEEVSPGSFSLSDSGVFFLKLCHFTANIFRIDTKFIEPDIKNN